MLAQRELLFILPANATRELQCDGMRRDLLCLEESQWWSRRPRRVVVYICMKQLITVKKQLTFTQAEQHGRPHPVDVTYFMTLTTRSIFATKKLAQFVSHICVTSRKLRHRHKAVEYVILSSHTRRNEKTIATLVQMAYFNVSPQD